MCPRAIIFYLFYDLTHKLALYVYHYNSSHFVFYTEIRKMRALRCYMYVTNFS